MGSSRLGAACALLGLIVAEAASAQSCSFRPAFERVDEGGRARRQVYEGAPDPRIGGARPLLFIDSLKVNNDGTRISYNARDPRAERIAINSVLNAMPRPRTYARFEEVRDAGWPVPRTWSVISSSVIERDRRSGRPCIDPDGYLISKTSEVAVAGGFGRDGDCDPAKWLDALTVPALVLPRGETQFGTRGASNRTPVVAMTIGAAPRIALGIVGDKGPIDQLGEASVAMNRILNGLPEADRPAHYRDAIARFQAPRSAVLLFPGAVNRVARPLTAASVSAATGALFERWGGKARLEACLKELPVR